MIGIIPKCLDDAIESKLDEAIAACPQAAKERAALRKRLLKYFDEHGFLPEFRLVPKDKESADD